MNIAIDFLANAYFCFATMLPHSSPSINYKTKQVVAQ